MKYYIFGQNNSQTIITSTKKAAFTSSNIDEAYNKFKSYVNESRYDNIYFIVDFGTSDPKFFKRSCLENDLEETMPFLIIGEWNLSSDKSDIIRNDQLYIKKYGFKHRFNNNLTAVKEFEFCISAGNYCELFITYAKPGYLDVDKTFDRLVSSSRKHFLEKPKYIRNIRIKSPSWMKCIDEKKSNVGIYDLKKEAASSYVVSS